MVHNIMIELENNILEIYFISFIGVVGSDHKLLIYEYVILCDAWFLLVHWMAYKQNQTKWFSFPL
jgi:hypothetical protein